MDRGGEYSTAPEEAVVNIYWMLMNVKVQKSCHDKLEQDPARDNS